jgi:hypothetical protein
MPTDLICSGSLQREDGSEIASVVTLSILIGQEPHGLGDIKGVIAVHNDPTFAGRNIGKRFVFVSAFDADDKMEVFIVDAAGACVAFPVAKRH